MIDKYYCKKCKRWHGESTQIFKEHFRYGLIPKDKGYLVLGIGDYAKIQEGIWEGQVGKIVGIPSETSVVIAFPAFGHLEKI